MEVCVQTVSAGFLIIKILVCTPADRFHLIFCCRSTHNGKYLSGQHHSHAFIHNAFYFSAMVIIIAIEPAIFSILHPFVGTDVFHHPVCFSLKISRKLIQSYNNCVSTDIMFTFLCVSCKECLLTCCVFIQFHASCKKIFHLMCNFNLAASTDFFQLTECFCNISQISGISTGKCNTFPLLPCHVQCIIPVGTMKTHFIMLSYIIERTQIL